MAGEECILPPGSNYVLSNGERRKRIGDDGQELKFCPVARMHWPLYVPLQQGRRREQAIPTIFLVLKIVPKTSRCPPAFHRYLLLQGRGWLCPRHFHGCRLIPFRPAYGAVSKASNFSSKSGALGANDRTHNQVHL